MSDPSNGERTPENTRDGDAAYGDPVEETTPEQPAVDDVVGSANDSLADAEAASRTSDRGDASFSFTDRGSDLGVDYGKYADDESAVPASAVSSEPLYRPQPDATDAASAPAAATAAYAHANETPATVTPSEPVTHSEPITRSEAVTERVDAAPLADRAPEAAAPTAVYSQQPIFVQAPEAPRPRGNRGVIGAIGLLAALVFAVLYLAAVLGFAAWENGIALADLPMAAVSALSTAAFWVPVVVFFLGFWLLGAFINRGRWGLWVVLGLLVGAVSYGGYLLGQLVAAPFWSIAPSQAATLIGEHLLAPLAVIAFVLGREVTVWFGAWASARGRRITELNDEAQREYERTLEAGPQLHQY
ncbi:ABC transporter [Microbacterium dauci]|uniref:ABC transporter n=1 Tax=Microbacterium dauci TaxID=3048008 RepID=A0ABT6ZDZ0_9MICO|nr:ABC transporter [Microbacterium sp. LX3-4]MDJ1114384.1 ABC transporter [Microbacterium sp. LX3-4]